jgi:hypothetical protein
MGDHAQVTSTTSSRAGRTRRGLARATRTDRRGIMVKRLTVCLASALAFGALFASSAAASLFQLWTDSTKTTLLRSVSTEPKNQPDALEFVGELSFKFLSETNVQCHEVEFGTTVVVNSPEGEAKTGENKLAMPFGVAEGDNCSNEGVEEGGSPVQVFFDTSGGGSVPATITYGKPGAGGALVGRLHKLKMSVFTPARKCTVIIPEGTELIFENPTGGLVEEAPPNLQAHTSEVAVTASCPPEKKQKWTWRAEFFLETPSTVTDTAFMG